MPGISDEDLMEREAALKALIEEVLPDFVKCCQEENNDVAVIHQDSFALDYQTDELLLLGRVIKFAGLYGKELRIIGRNRETLSASAKLQLV
jgi:hypothetical protein